MQGPGASPLTLWLPLAWAALLCAAQARAHGGIPEPRQILLPADRPERIILVTNFGLIFSEDGGDNWLFSCEHGSSAYAGPYLLGSPPAPRIFGMAPGAGLIYSDDDACSWQGTGGALTNVLPYAFTLDASNSQRVYAIGVPRSDLGGGDSIYVSDDGGLSFREPAFTAPARSALLTVIAAPSQPSTLYATMFSTPENHPILLLSRDSGEHWESAADLVDSVGQNPFELLAVDPLDENKLYGRILGISAETLAISEDGGVSFVPSVSIPGKLHAFLELASGTILVGGTAGIAAAAYRSRDGGRSFERWLEAPHVHALAERNGKLYVGADNFADGYAIAASEDEGATLRPLAGFAQVRGLVSCVADVCAQSCAYYAGIKLWPDTVCAAPLPAAVGSDASSARASDPPALDREEAPASQVSGDLCSYGLVARPSAQRWMALLAAATLLAGRRVHLLQR